MASRTVVLALVLAALAAGPAAADSIVYEKDGNVWQAAPDGSRQTQVTTSGGYLKPTQADDGTIVAVKDGLLHRMDRAGRLLNTAGERGGTGPITPHLQPSGGLVAYDYFFSGQFSYALSHASRETAHEEIHYISGRMNPTWIGNERVLLFDGSTTTTGDTLLYRLGETMTTTWFEDSELDLKGGEIDASQTRLAATDGARIRLYRLNQPPPANDVSAKCDLTGPVGSFFRPTWSPDGGALAWQEDDGIWMGRVDLDTCPNEARVVIPGGRAPDWGPADVSTPAGPGTTATALVITAAVPGSVRRRTLLRELKVKAGCERACRVTADLLVDKRTVKRLRLKSRRIARKRASAPAAGRATLKLRPGSKVRRRMRGRRVRSVTVRLRAVDGAGVAAAAVSRRVAVRG